MTDVKKVTVDRVADAHFRSGPPSMTRRQLLAGTGQIALLAVILPTACMPVVNAPWADGTFWDDGKGWAD